ncbi:MAG: MarR family winged helix-turn-helix transcriptional regulator [Candidatus Entotheonellia bacterium]
MGTTGMTPDLCAREVMEAVPVVMRFIRAEMRQQGKPVLSVSQFRALVFLNLAPGAPLREVADYVGVTRPTASALVDRLVRYGLVDRVHHPRQRRQIMLTLTAKGSELLQLTREATRFQLVSLLADLSPGQVQKIGEGMALLVSLFKEAAAPRPK